MDNWDKAKGRFKQTYEDAAYLAERAKKEYEWRIDGYTHEAEKYGKWLGVDRSGGGHNDDMDAFRHAYTSAKVAKDYGQVVATTGGVFHEVKGQVQDIIHDEEPNGEDPYNQPLPESIMDEHNNSVGRELGERARQEGWSDRKLAEEVKRAMDEGKLIRKPEYGPKVPGYPGSESDASSTQPQASILDYFGQAAGQIGAAVSTVGHVAFDTAMGLGKETLNQTLRLALSQGAGGKAMVKQAAQMAMGNMLASMHAQVMAQVMRDPRIPVGIAPDSPMDTVPRGSIEEVMNSPRNQGVFDQIADAVIRLLGRHPDLDPGTVLLDQGLKHIRQGDLKIPHGVVLPDIFAMDHKHPKNGNGTSAGGHYVEIFGIQLPIRLPEIGGFDGKIDENPDAGKMPGGGNGGLFAFRNADGMVQVSGYSRGGSNVRSHTRSKPDGDVTNNLSYRSKA